jgi:hypothetical protein
VLLWFSQGYKYGILRISNFHPPKKASLSYNLHKSQLLVHPVFFKCDVANKIPVNYLRGQANIISLIDGFHPPFEVPTAQSLVPVLNSFKSFLVPSYFLDLKFRNSFNVSTITVRIPSQRRPRNRWLRFPWLQDRARPPQRGDFYIHLSRLP